MMSYIIMMLAGLRNIFIRMGNLFYQKLVYFNPKCLFLLLQVVQRTEKLHFSLSIFTVLVSVGVQKYSASYFLFTIYP